LRSIFDVSGTAFLLILDIGDDRRAERGWQMLVRLIKKTNLAPPRRRRLAMTSVAGRRRR
jgi:hypothetical protein